MARIEMRRIVRRLSLLTVLVACLMFMLFNAGTNGANAAICCHYCDGLADRCVENECAPTYGDDCIRMCGQREGACRRTCIPGC